MVSGRGLQGFMDAMSYKGTQVLPYSSGSYYFLSHRPRNKYTQGERALDSFKKNHKNVSNLYKINNLFKQNSCVCYDVLNVKFTLINNKI